MIYLLFMSCSNAQDKVYTQHDDYTYEINSQYFYGEKVHTYLIDLPAQILLFDLPTYSKEVEEFIRSFNKPVLAIISHGSCGIADGSLWQEKIDLIIYGHSADKNHPWIRTNPDVLFTKVPEFDPNVEVIHTPGHSPGSICVLDKRTKSMFTGDTFYGNEKGEIRDFTLEQQASYENLEDRISSCKKLLAYEFDHVYPFHYEIIKKRGKSALTEYLLDK